MRKYYVDYLRVIAVLAVITLHITSYYSRLNSISTVTWWVAAFLNASSRFCVPLFVMMSGVVLLGRPIDADAFYKKRATRLIPPLLFWTFIYSVFTIYTQGMSFHTAVMFLVFGLLEQGKAYVHLWYLSMFLCLMLFVPFLNNAITGKQLTGRDFKLLLLILIAFYTLNTISTYAHVFRDVDIYWFKTFPWYIGYFLTGFYIDKYVSVINAKNINLIIYIFTITLIGTILRYYLTTEFHIYEDYLILGNDGVLVFFISVFIFALAKKNEHLLLSKKLILHISEASFGIYLIHPIFVYLLFSHIANYKTYGLIYIPFSILVVFVLSYFSIYFLRLNSIMRKLC